MKTIYKGLLLSLIFCLTWSVQAADFTLPDYKKVTLENGLTLYLMEQHEVPLVDVLVTVKAGAVEDLKQGSANMTADAIMLGSQSFPKAEFEAKLDFVGANMTSFASQESSYLHASFAAKDTTMVMDLVEDALLHPAFDQTEFDHYKQRYLAGLIQQQESPKAVIKSYFDKLMYGQHPYANVRQGTQTSVEKIALDDLQGFYQRWYTPDNTAIIVVGDIDSNAMAKQLTRRFGSWRGHAPQRSVSTQLPTPQKTHVVLVDKPDAIESTFMIGGPGIKRSNPDFIAVSVVNTILGGRFTSWLNDELRVNSGLTYGARSGFDSHINGGSFYISTFTKTTSTKQAIDLALKTYQRLFDKGIDKATLASAKAYVQGQFPPRYETSEQLADLLADMYIYGFDENYINEFNQKVNQLDKAKVSEIIQRYFPRHNLQFVVVGNADKIRDVVKQYGPVKQVSIRNPGMTF